jgi:two-component SAPR family response regulator
MADESKSNVLLLEIRTFGQVQVRLNQQVLSLSDWQTREARDLFFFLLHSEPLTKEQIGLAFWPDLSPARLKMRFKINIYRIRRAVGQNVILFEDDRYRFNRDVSHDWDRERVNRLTQALPQAQDMEKIELLKQITNHLKRPYLENLDAEWAVSDRLHYQERYQTLMVDLAGLYLKHDRIRDCLETARVALEMDPLLEAAHRLIIQAYASLHDPAGMTLQYRTYQQILMTELGLQPSSEISTLYMQLLDAI